MATFDVFKSDAFNLIEMKLADVIATEADWYTGGEAVKLGLMDGIMTEAEAWGALEEHIRKAA